MCFLLYSFQFLIGCSTHWRVDMKLWSYCVYSSWPLDWGLSSIHLFVHSHKYNVIGNCHVTHLTRHPYRLLAKKKKKKCLASSGSASFVEFDEWDSVSNLSLIFIDIKTTISNAYVGPSIWSFNVATTASMTIAPHTINYTRKTIINR